MIARTPRFALLCAILLAAASPTVAGEPAPAAPGSEADAVAELEALFPKGETACFARRYDAAHLERHPTQGVTSVRLMRGFQQVREDAFGDEGLVHADLIVTHRDAGERRVLAGASCRAQEDGTILCSLEACGGAFALTRQGADAIAIGGGAIGDHMTVAGDCGDGDKRSLMEGEDDRFLHLQRAPMTACR